MGDMTERIGLDQIIRKANTIAIGGHEHPDGDCAGSVTGLACYIKNLCPGAAVDIYLEKIPDAYAYIGEGLGILGACDPACGPYDLFICLDCGNLDRLGFAQKAFERAEKTVCIDHHISNPGFADINRICPDASSTSEMLAEELDPQYMDTAVAERLFLGIVHDSGVFQYPSTSAETHRIAADLLAYDFNASQLITKTYYDKTIGQQQIGAQAVLNARLILGGKMIYSVITAEEMERFAVRPEDLDGIVAQLRDTTGVECAVLLYERGLNEWKVSMRSRTFLDVRSVAQTLGGGGHQRAAGVTLKSDDPGKIIDQITSLVKQQLTAED